jgi:hypothetical protein
MGRFARKARRAGFEPIRHEQTTQFQADPLAYIRAVRAGLCPYDGAPLSAEAPAGASPPDCCRREPPPGLMWCAKCERGFGPVESSE